MAIDETELSGRESGFGVGEEGAHLLDGGVLERAAKAVNFDSQGVGFGFGAEMDRYGPHYRTAARMPRAVSGFCSVVPIGGFGGREVYPQMRQMFSDRLGGKRITPSRSLRLFDV